MNSASTRRMEVSRLGRDFIAAPEWVEATMGQAAVQRIFSREGARAIVGAWGARVVEASLEVPRSGFFRRPDPGRRRAGERADPIGRLAGLYGRRPGQPGAADQRLQQRDRLRPGDAETARRGLLQSRGALPEPGRGLPGARRL